MPTPDPARFAAERPRKEVSAVCRIRTTRGTPPEVIARINAEVRALFAEQAFLDRVIVPNMFETMVTSPEQFAEYIKRDSAKWAKVLREANIKAE